MGLTTVDLDGDQFGVWDTGGTSDSIVVFLHGFPLSHTMWSRQIERFASQHRVIAPDLRGHGISVVTDGTVTMRMMADDVVSLLDCLGIRQPVTFCGLSMGGYVSWELWRQHRQRVARLILCDTRAAADAPEVARAREIMAAQVMDAGAEVAEKAFLPKLFSPTNLETQPQVVNAVRQMILATDRRAIAATQLGMARRFDMVSQLGQVNVPTLVICGEDDAISPPAEMKGIADAMPQASYVEIPGAGHMAPMENPTAVCDAIRDFVNSG